MTHEHRARSIGAPHSTTECKTAQWKSNQCDMQDSYDGALQQGLQCALENMDLRAELAAAANVRANAVSLARSQSAADAAASKLHLQTK